jgi:hypothetical protein
MGGADLPALEAHPQTESSAESGAFSNRQLCVCPPQRADGRSFGASVSRFDAHLRCLGVSTKPVSNVSEDVGTDLFHHSATL